MFKKFLFITLFTLGLVLLFSSKAYAAVDITLKNISEANILEVIVNSNDDELSGIDMDIVFSDSLVVKKINEPENYCVMGFNSVASNGIISIECLNDKALPLNNSLVTIEYIKNGDDLYFYTDQTTLDIGGKRIGELIDVNKPENLAEKIDRDLIKEEAEDNLVNKIVEIIKDNYIVISIIVIGIVIILLSLLFIKS
jgi:hypothetical protein